MNNKHAVVRKLLRLLGPVAVRNIAGPAQVPYGTIMNIRGERSTDPRYDNVYKLYRHFIGRAPCELAYVTEQLKGMTTAEVRQFAKRCGVSYHTLIKMKQQRQKCAPSYAHVNAAYRKLKSQCKVNRRDSLKE